MAFVPLFLFFLIGRAGDIYVSQEASSGGDGSRSAPFRTLERALREARAWRTLDDDRTRGGITIWMADGVYAPAQTVRIRPEDSGTPESPTRIRALGDYQDAFVTSQ